MSELGFHKIETVKAIPDQYLGNLLAAIGNHEGKALVLASMQSGEAYGITALHSLYVLAQGDNPAHVGAKNNQIDYCIYSFEPIGAVAKVTDGGSLRYEISEEGERYGKAFAGLVLDFSLRYPDISLSQLFGQTFTKYDGDARSPLRRVELLRALQTGDSTSQADIMHAVSRTNGSVRFHIDELAALGIVEKEAQTLDEYQVTISCGARIETYEQVGSQKTLTASVVSAYNKLISSGQSIMQTDIEAALKADYGYEEWSDESLRNATSKVLAGLVGQGVVIKESVFDRWRRSHVRLALTKKAAVLDILDELDKFQSGDVDILEKWRKRADEIVTDTNSARVLIGKAIGASPQANKKPREERMAVVAKYLSEAHTATTSEIMHALNDKGVPRGAVTRALSDLRQSGRIESIAIGRQAVWALASKSTM